MTELTRSLPENLQALVIDFVMAATDLPERGEIVKRLRKALNLGEQEAPKTPEEAQAMQAAQAEQQQAAVLQQRAVELDLADKEAKVGKTNAEAARAQAQADAAAAGPIDAAMIQQLTEQVAALTEIVGNIGARLQ